MAEGRLWEKILRDSAHKIRYEESHLVLLGTSHTGSREAGIGKLISAMQTGPGSSGKVKYTELEPLTAPDAAQVSPLMYEYLNVKNIEDSQSEKIAKMNVWVLDDPTSHSLLDIVLRPQVLKHTILGIVLDFAQPWTFMKSLRMWLDLWHQKLGRVVSMLPLAEQDELVTRVTEYVRNFNCSTGEAPPLSEGVLTVNMGVPIVIVCTNSDLCYKVEKSRDSSEETLDYLIRSLRRFSLDCTPHTDGAALIYVSPKTSDNIEVLYEYLMHRAYGFRFGGQAQVLVRESVFVPAGWDSLNLISELDYVKGKDRVFEEVFPEPRGRVQASEEVAYEEEQGFLREAQDKIRSITRQPVGPSQKRELRKLEVPNPGGEVAESVQEPSARNQSTLEKFYKDLLDKGSKDQPKTSEA